MEHLSDDLTSVPVQSPRLLHYQILSRLGQGGFGEVYEAWDAQLRRKVAIKRLKTLATVKHPNSMLREARLAASIQHPAFVKIFSIEEDGDGHAIVMELIPGVTWRELVGRDPADLPRLLDIMQQLADAMHEAHQSGLVHGDLKPSNLMLDPAGRARILDLGLAFHDDAQATTSMMELEQQGTIAYMAPECLLGSPTSRQSDIYAMGVILYELVTGSRPFGPLSGLALAAAQMQSSSASWGFPATVPAAIVELVRAMTARQLDQRLSSMQEVSRQLAACASGVPEAAPAQPVRKARPTWRLRRGPLASSALVLLLAAGAWGVASYPSLPEPFAKARTIEHALDALQQFDRPDQLDVAATGFRSVLDHDPANAAAAAGLSLVYSFRYAGDSQDETWLQRAKASAQQALKLDRHLALNHAAYAWVLGKQGQREQALAECERALALEPGNYFAALGKAMFLTQLRRYDEAHRWIALAMQRHPGERVFADALGTVHFEQGHYAAAEQAFRSSIRLQPDSVFAYANLNATLLRQNRSEEALRVLQQGLQVRPSGVLLTSLGNALFARGDYVGAADAFERAVTPPGGNPNSYLAWANLGDTLLWIPGAADRARAAYRKATSLLAPRLQRTPNDATLLSRMGLYSARIGEAAASADLHRRAVAAAPNSPDVHFRAGLAYELLGNRVLALDEISKARRSGYPASAVEYEPDLVALRRDARYQPHQLEGEH
jgi:tetratricopeptide (TPR) repeat protein